MSQCETPIADPIGASYVHTESSLVTLSCATLNSYIVFTLNGGDPITYINPIRLAKSADLVAVANAPTYNQSDALEETYSICDPVVFNPIQGTYREFKFVTLTTITSGASIYYTLDGTIPTAASTAYTAPFEIGSNSNIVAIAIKASFSDSLISQAQYLIIKNDLEENNISINQSPVIVNLMGSSKVIPQKFGSNNTTTLSGRPKQQYVNLKNKITLNIDKISQSYYDKLFDMWVSDLPIYLKTERTEFIKCLFSQDTFDLDTEQDIDGNIFYYGKLELED